MKEFIADNLTRCNNSDCKRKGECKRFAQFSLDMARGIHPKSVVNFKSEGCEKIIRFA